MRYILILILTVLTTIPNLNAQLSLGVNVGSTRMNFSGDPPQGIGFFSPRMGYFSSLQLDYRFQNGFALSAQPGLSILRSKYSVLNDSGTQVIDSTNFTLRGVSVPLHCIVWSENGRFYVLAGLDFSFLIDFRSEVVLSEVPVSNNSYEVSKLNIYGQFGAGFIIHIGKPYLNFELRYSQGLNDLTAPIVNQEVYLPRTKLTNISLLVGLHIPLGRTSLYSVKKKKS